MLVLALDQASRTTGYSIWKDDQLIKYGKIIYDDKDALTRIVKLGDRIDEIISKLSIDNLVIENIQLEHGTNNVAAFQILAQLQGVLAYVAHKNNIPITILRPTEWRSICNFLKNNDVHRAAQKKKAQDWVMQEFNEKCTQDEAEAICIGYAYLHQKVKELNWE